MRIVRIHIEGNAGPGGNLSIDIKGNPVEVLGALQAAAWKVCADLHTVAVVGR